MQIPVNPALCFITRQLTAGLLLTALALTFACQPQNQNGNITATDASNLPPAASPTSSVIEPGAKARRLKLVNKPWFGDFDAMTDRRAIRVLVPYSRTLFFNDKGRERGITAELIRDFEHYINDKLRSQLDNRPITVYLIPTTRDRLFQELAAGRGDIAAGNLTVTKERLEIVDFVSPQNQPVVKELLVTGPASPKINALTDLSGKSVHVRPSSSYNESLKILNGQLLKAGLPVVNVVALPEALEDEDTLELLNAGLIKYTVVDDWKARIWAQVLPKIAVREDLVLRGKGYIGWAIRKQSPLLRAILVDSYQNFAKKQGIIDHRLANYHKNIRQISNITEGVKWRQFEQVIALFTKYGSKYDFDPLLLAAQGYQESGLRQDARSEAGAIGVMQIMPATGKDLKVS
jgi:membrane-bound lytic murein transglycosylase MltF